MQKKLSGVCGFLLFGTFGMLSGIAQVHPPERAAQSEAVTLQDDGWQREDMSDEEKERRREECNTAFEACWDWCKRSNPKSEPARWKCRDECKKKLVECMKKIPGNPIEEPDY